MKLCIFKQDHPVKIKKTIKQYSKEEIAAYDIVCKKRMKVDQAAREFGVPSQTLQGRVLKKIEVGETPFSHKRKNRH